MIGMTVFKMHTRDGEKHQFVYTGNMRYSPNKSSVCGYGSDDWIYLCQYKGKDCLLMFSDSAEYGCSWICYVMGVEHLAALTSETVDIWYEMIKTKTQRKIYALKLENIDELRSVLPRASRCTGSFQDKHFG